MWFPLWQPVLWEWEGHRVACEPLLPAPGVVESHSNMSPSNVTFFPGASKSDLAIFVSLRSPYCQRGCMHFRSSFMGESSRDDLLNASVEQQFFFRTD